MHSQGGPKHQKFALITEAAMAVSNCRYLIMVTAKLRGPIFSYRPPVPVINSLYFRFILFFFKLTLIQASKNSR